MSTEENTNTADGTTGAAVQVSADNSPTAASIWTKRLLILSIVIWTWHLFADRLTPYSEHTRMRTHVVPLVPQVSGKVVEIDVDFNQRVNAGDLLFKIDQTDFLLALEQAEAGYEQATQNIGASGDDIISAEAKLTQDETYLEYALTEARRYDMLADKGVISKSEQARVASEVDKARADVARAEADLSKAKTRLGEEGANNPRVRQAYVKLRQASLNLARTEVRAPSTGAVVNATFAEGQYATAGQPLMTFMDTRLVWLESYIRENSLGNIKAGDEVDISLDKAPGKVFKGKVSSITFGVKWNKSGQNANTLPTISVKEGWLRESQRFPVIITFDDDSSMGYRLEGGQADVVIYTSSNFFLNSIAWLQIRFMSYLSYLF
ncbi:MAG: multidrug resistance efflux pump [Pseudomonadales bacterium]|jgi:multidrug resistance efflux pump